MSEDSKKIASERPPPREAARAQILTKVAPDEDGATEYGKKTALPEVFTVAEADLPGVLGVSRDLIRSIRQKQLAEGVDWVKRHKDILLTPAGAEKIGRTLALISGAEAPAEATSRESASTGFDTPPALEKAPAVKVEVFRVLRSGFKNRMMVSAFDPAEPSRIVWVRVRDNSKWVPGMEISATHAQHDQYVLHGHNPRWRGKV